MISVVFCDHGTSFSHFLSKFCGEKILLSSYLDSPIECDILAVAEDFCPNKSYPYPKAALFLGSQTAYRGIFNCFRQKPPFESLVFCGMKSQNTLLFSSVSKYRALLCVQRAVILRGSEISIGEYPVDIDPCASLYENLIASFICLCDRMC